MRDRLTRSVCPICLEPVAATLQHRDGAVYLHKACPRHGTFTVPVWRDQVDMDDWCQNASALPSGQGLGCPQKCGICEDHEQGSCCVLLEVTNRCNLRCSYCFAQGGELDDDPPFEDLKVALSDIQRLAGRPLLQLSGGEPTLRDDLADLVAYAKGSGYAFIQLNTNGIRLATDKEYVKDLAKAGLSFVFMQFDSISDEANVSLRGKPLLETKLRAIENCDAYNLGVTLVPTVVRGVNDHQLGDLVRLGASLSPAVRGVHFQPLAYLGRGPKTVDDRQRYTLDDLIHNLYRQTGLAEGTLKPSRCDHPLCGFHGSFMVGEDGSLRPLPGASAAPRSSAEQNRNYVALRWLRDSEPKADGANRPTCCCGNEALPDISTFLRKMKAKSFTLTAMDFQDAMNLNVERLHRCSLHVYDGGKIKPFCAKYLTPLEPS